MWRQAISRLINGASRTAGKTTINRELSAKTPILNGKSGNKGCGDSSKKPCQKKKSPCAGVITHENSSERKSPCAQQKQHPCPPVKVPCARTNPCPPANPCTRPCPPMNTPCPPENPCQPSRPCPPSGPCEPSGPCQPCAGGEPDLPAYPCPPGKTSPCIEVSNLSNRSSGNHSDKCAHHKDLIPPMDALSRLKGFEVKSGSTSFHMLTTGQDCC